MNEKTIYQIVQEFALKTGWIASRQLELVCEYLDQIDIQDDFIEFMEGRADETLTEQAERQAEYKARQAALPYANVTEYNGVHFYTISDLAGPWKVVMSDDFHRFPQGSWYIYNIETGRSKRIGPVRWKGTNYYDRAVAEVTQRNKEWAEKLAAKREAEAAAIAKADRELAERIKYQGYTVDELLHENWPPEP